MLERISHSKFGLGVVIDERPGVGSGKPVCVVIFDNSPEIERTILTEFLQQSSARMPAFAKVAVKKKKATPKPKLDAMKDTLLVEGLDPYLPEDSDEVESVTATGDEF